jgi:hypothetical protein
MKVFTFLAAVSMATPVAAQGPASVEMRSVGAVYVRTVGGDEARGQLLRLGPDTLTLLEQGTSRDIPLAGITRIDASGDSVKNGAIIGAVILGAWCAIICGQGLDNANQVTTVALINTGLGALIGAGVDAMHAGRTTIYHSGAVTPERRPSGVKATLSRSFRF